MRCRLYRVLWFNSLGYVVYRHVVNAGGDEIRTRLVAIEHKTAVFVTENEAKDYCSYRNRMTEDNGTDALQKSR